MKIGGASLNQTPLDWQGNADRIREAIRLAREAGVSLLCLPELAISGYSCEDMFMHPWVSARAKDELLRILPETKGIAVAIGLPVRWQEATYNAVAFVHDGHITGIYAKQNLPKDGIHYEFRWFEAWTPNRTEQLDIQGYAVPFGHITVAWEGKKIGFEICEDAWVPNRPCSLLPEKVDLIINPSASHFAFGKVKRRQEIIRASSEVFRCVYLYTNQVGNEAGRVIYDGDVIIAQQGKLLATARRFSFHDVNLHAIEVDFADPAKSETSLYDQITDKNEEFPQAVSLALFDYLRKSKSQGFVLSLSGGADSGAIAVLVAEMVRRGTADLGAEAFEKKLGLSPHPGQPLMARLLTTAYQGTVNSSETTFRAAKAVAEAIGATFHYWTIDDEVQSYTRKIEEAVGRKLTWSQDDIALQNIQARARSPIIWMLANLKNALLLATSNRSEGAMGYATMDGDTSGSISPIAGADKAFVLEWLQYAETELGYTALAYINAQQPTAELRPPEQTQTDEADLMPYPVLKEIERMFILDRKSPEEITAALVPVHGMENARAWVQKFFRLWKRNQWKRERLAPSFHLDDYNLDPRSWMRYPILSGE